MSNGIMSKNSSMSSVWNNTSLLTIYAGIHLLQKMYCTIQGIQKAMVLKGLLTCVGDKQ